MKLPDGNQPEVSGVYRAIEKNKRLVSTWAWTAEGRRARHETEVTITFEPVGKHTRAHAGANPVRGGRASRQS